MFKKIISLFLSLSLIITQPIFAQGVAQLNIAQYLGQTGPAATDNFRPTQLRYFSYDSFNNSFRILLDKGDVKDIKDNQLKEQAKELMDYFLIGLTLPNDAFWVNLRPDSPDNIIDPELEKTDLGRILLEADLQLKKDTAGLTSPQTPEGKAYWDKLYKKAGELFGTENITIPTITRPWIVPGEIIVRESGNSAYIYKATLKVLLEQDHLKDSSVYNFSDPRLKELNEYSSQIIRETIIPKLTQEVNSSKRYVKLRQVYYSLVLSRWFKQKYSSLRSIRAPGHQSASMDYIGMIDSGNLTNLTAKEPYDKLTYFKQYQESFAKGEYNLKEPVYTPYGQSIRSYMSGGFNGTKIITAGVNAPETAGSSILGESLKNRPDLLQLEISGNMQIKLASNQEQPNALAASPVTVDVEFMGRFFEITNHLYLLDGTNTDKIDKVLVKIGGGFRRTLHNTNIYDFKLLLSDTQELLKPFAANYPIVQEAIAGLEKLSKDLEAEYKLDENARTGIQKPNDFPASPLITLKDKINEVFEAIEKKINDPGLRNYQEELALFLANFKKDLEGPLGEIDAIVNTQGTLKDAIKAIEKISTILFNKENEIGNIHMDIKSKIVSLRRYDLLSLMREIEKSIGQRETTASPLVLENEVKAIQRVRKALNDSHSNTILDFSKLSLSKLIESVKKMANEILPVNSKGLSEEAEKWLDIEKELSGIQDKVIGNMETYKKELSVFYARIGKNLGKDQKLYYDNYAKTIKAMNDPDEIIAAAEQAYKLVHGVASPLDLKNRKEVLFKIINELNPSEGAYWYNKEFNFWDQGQGEQAGLTKEIKQKFLALKDEGFKNKIGLAENQVLLKELAVEVKEAVQGILPHLFNKDTIATFEAKEKEIALLLRSLSADILSLSAGQLNEEFKKGRLNYSFLDKFLGDVGWDNIILTKELKVGKVVYSKYIRVIFTMDDDSANEEKIIVSVSYDDKNHPYTMIPHTLKTKFYKNGRISTEIEVDSDNEYLDAKEEIMKALENGNPVNWSDFVGLITETLEFQAKTAASPVTVDEKFIDKFIDIVSPIYVSDDTDTEEISKAMKEISKEYRKMLRNRDVESFRSLLSYAQELLKHFLSHPFVEGGMDWDAIISKAVDNLKELSYSLEAKYKPDENTRQGTQKPKGSAASPLFFTDDEKKELNNIINEVRAFNREYISWVREKRPDQTVEEIKRYMNTVTNNIKNDIELEISKIKSFIKEGKLKDEKFVIEKWERLESQIENIKNSIKNKMQNEFRNISVADKTEVEEFNKFMEKDWLLKAAKYVGFVILSNDDPDAGKWRRLAKDIIDYRLGSSQQTSASSITSELEISAFPRNPLGGIDFTSRAMKIGIERMGSFADLKLVLPEVSNVAAIDLDNEFKQIQLMASSGIRPSDTRILEFAAACYYRGEFGPRLGEITACLQQAHFLDERLGRESSPALRLATMLPEVM